MSFLLLSGSWVMRQLRLKPETGQFLRQGS